MRETPPHSTANPFRVPPEVVPSSRKRAFYSALKVCLVAACALVVTMVLATQSGRWLFYRLTADYASLPAQAQSLRLVEVAGLGEIGIPFLTTQLAADDASVARQAYDSLAEEQRQWALLSESQCRTRHELFIAALHEVIDDIEDERFGWVTSLLQQTIVEHVPQSDIASRHLHLDAADLMARLSISTRPDIRIASVTSDETQGLVIRPQPLAVDTAADAGTWTDWPPRDEPESTPASDDAPSIYRSGTKSRGVPPLAPQDPQSVSLKPFRQSEPVDEIRPHPEANDEVDLVETATHEMEAPLETYNIRSVIYWLASTDHELRRQAELELLRRGLDANQIAIAKSLSLGDVQDRLATIERIVHDDTLDPRPWLMWLLDDEHRDVKLHVINILATVPDPAVRTALRDRIATENDLTVAARIRRVLELR